MDTQYSILFARIIEKKAAFVNQNRQNLQFLGSTKNYKPKNNFDKLIKAL
jgi:hypothetical protein